MSLISWWCETERKVVPLDHFEKAGFDHTPMPVLMLRHVVEEANNPPVKHHREPEMSPSACLGCPRELLITRFLDFTPDPRGYNSLFWGSAVHKHLERIDNGGWWHEFPIPQGATVKDDIPINLIHTAYTKPPTILGVPMYGVIDRLKKDFTEMEDYKTMSERAYDWHCSRELGSAKPDACAQLNLYRLMLQEVFGKSPTKMRVWMGAQCSAGKDPWDYADVPVMDEDEIRGVRPGGGQYTLGQIFDVTSAAFVKIKRFRKLEPKGDFVGMIRSLVYQIPFIGASQYAAKKCFAYCKCPRECAAISNPRGELPPTGKGARRRPPSTAITTVQNPFMKGI